MDQAGREDTGPAQKWEVNEWGQEAKEQSNNGPKQIQYTGLARSIKVNSGN